MTSLYLKRLLPHLLPNAGTVVVVIFILFTYTAWAAPSILPSAQGVLPAIIPYQGTLTNAAGQPINGNTSLTFRLYAAPSGGSALWTEARTGANVVPVSNGLFNVNLGSLTPIPSAVWKNNPLYLGIQVNSDPEMAPREQLGAVPYAMMAGALIENVVKVYKSVTGEAVTFGVDSKELIAVDVTLDKPASVMIVVGARALNRSDQEALFTIVRNGFDVIGGDIHWYAPGSSGGHQYFNFTHLDPNLTPGQYRYIFKGRLASSGADKWIHQPSITAIVIPQ